MTDLQVYTINMLPDFEAEQQGADMSRAQEGAEQSEAAAGCEARTLGKRGFRPFYRRMSGTCNVAGRRMRAALRGLRGHHEQPKLLSVREADCIRSDM